MKKRLTPIVRRLRRNKTQAENRLWSRLRNSQLEVAKFRFQTQVGDFVPDFLCSEAMLIVELDGSQHGVAIEKDAARTMALEATGYTVMRFWNNDVLENTDGVLEEIRWALLNMKGC